MNETPITDITGHPELLPEGEWFTLHHADGTVGLAMPRADVAYYASTGAPCLVRELTVEPPF